MRSTALSVLQPAQFKVPDHISKVAIIDRSKPSNGWLNVAEGLFTGENIGQDRRCRQEAMAGLTNALIRTPRFNAIGTAVEMNGTKAGASMPYPLDWSEVERICGDYSADAVVAMESFDSNNAVNTRKIEEKKKDKNGKSYVDTRFDALLRTEVRMGWRLYDPKTKIILDEFSTSDYLERSSSGRTEKDAVANLPHRVSVTRDVAFNLGLEYGARIAPVYVTLTRQYYAKAKGYKTQMQQAVQYAKNGEWDNARSTWESIVRGGNAKAAGRAAYNIAVAYEVMGDLDNAILWAQKSWSEFGNKKGRNYVQILKQRQNDARKVQDQLPGKRV